MTTTFHAHSAADLLAAIPTMAGYTPEDSVVIIPFCGTSSVGLFRFDLPPGEPAQFAATAMGIVCRLEEATGIMVVIYAQKQHGSPANHPFQELSRAIHITADACGLDIGDVLFVTADGWFGADDDELHSLQDLGVQGEVEPPPPGVTQSSGTALPAVPTDRVKSLTRALAQIDRDLAGEHETPLIAPLADIHDVFESAVELRRGTVKDDARLLWLLNRPSLRDVALSQWCHGREIAEDTLQHQLDWLDGIPYPSGEVFLMGEGAPPDVDRLRAVLHRLRFLAASSKGSFRAAALACAAWISWALGHSTHADLYARQALSAEPRHGLSQIIATLCANGHLPDWAFPVENRRPHDKSAR